MWTAVALFVVSALITYAFRPKVEGAKPQQAKAPRVEEGKKIPKIYGTVWINDPMVLGFKRVGTDPIKSKSGKT